LKFTKTPSPTFFHATSYLRFCFIFHSTLVLFSLSPRFPRINCPLLFSHPTATAVRFALTLSQVYHLPLLISHLICGFDFWNSHLGDVVLLVLIYGVLNFVFICWFIDFVVNQCMVLLTCCKIICYWFMVLIYEILICGSSDFGCGSHLLIYWFCCDLWSC
jgi:hypothetical protein